MLKGPFFSQMNHKIIQKMKENKYSSTLPRGTAKILCGHIHWLLHIEFGSNGNEEKKLIAITVRMGKVPRKIAWDKKHDKEVTYN